MLKQVFDHANNERQVIGHMIGHSVRKKMKRFSFSCELSETSVKSNSVKCLSFQKAGKTNAELSCFFSD